jgi:hypothetical protein
LRSVFTRSLREFISPRRGHIADKWRKRLRLIALARRTFVITPVSKSTVSSSPAAAGVGPPRGIQELESRC